MTDWIDELPLSDDLQLDLLVDNELNEAQRQKLLTHLEGEPERWRMLALRFVEGQMTAGGVQRWMAETRNAGTQTLPNRKRANARRLKARERWFMVLAMCVAFGCGVAADGWLSGSGESIPAPIAQTPVPEATPAIGEPTPPAVADSTEPAPRSLSPEGSQMVANEVEADTQLERATRPIRIPLRRVRSADGQQTWTPRRLVASKEPNSQQSGADVQRRMGVMRVPLGRQRHVVMPVQQTPTAPRRRYRI